MSNITKKQEKRLDLQISIDVFNKIKEIAKSKQLTVSSFIRLLLITYIEEYKDETDSK